MGQELKKKLALLEPEEIQAILEKHQSQKISEPALKPSAVLLPLLKRDGIWHLLFTKRSQKVEAHKGEISFPGGVIEENETPQQAVLRECEEELGIKSAQIQILGKLDEILTITGFKIQPFVGILKEELEFNPNPEEIEEILILPLEQFLEPGRLQVENWSYQGRDYPVYFFHLPGVVVWGATAKITKNFLEQILDFSFSDL